GFDELHGVVDCHARVHRTPGGVDVQRDVLVGILGLEKEQLGHNKVCRLIIDRTDKENNALTQQARVNVVRTFAAARLLDNDGHVAQPCGHDGVAPVHRGVEVSESLHIYAVPISSSKATVSSVTWALDNMCSTTLSSSTRASTSARRSRSDR